MKNFKKVLFGVLAMLVMVTGVNAAVGTKTTDVDPDIRTTEALETCLTATESGTCTLQEDLVYDKAQVIVHGIVTLNLNGHKLTMNNDLVVQKSAADKAAELNIIGGELDLATYHITADQDTKLTVNGTNVKGTGTMLFEVKGTAVSTGARDEANSTVVDINARITNDATNGTGLTVVSGNAIITLNGDWATKGVTIEGNGNALITIKGGVYSSTDTNIYWGKAGTPEFVVEGGSLTSKGAASSTMNVAAGTVTVKGGDIVSTGKYAAWVNAAGKLVVEGGTLTSNASNAVRFDANNDSKVSGGRFVATKASAIDGTTGVPVLTGGEYVTGKDITSYVRQFTVSGYKAVKIGDTEYVGKAATLYIDMNKENGKEVLAISPKDDMLIGREYKFADKYVQEFLKAVPNDGYVVKYVLSYDGKEVEVTGDGFVMPEAEGKVTLKVSFVPASTVNPEDQGGTTDPGKGDETTDKNPGTFDGIASFVTLAVSSLGAAGYSIKKVIKR